MSYEGPSIDLLNVDPITGRTICNICWNGVHGASHSHADCKCLCREGSDELFDVTIEPQIVCTTCGKGGTLKIGGLGCYQCKKCLGG